MLVSKACTLSFHSREGEAVFQSPLRKLIFYHLQLTFKCITTGPTEDKDVMDVQRGRD
jgi:hypothetical protein